MKRINGYNEFLLEKEFQKIVYEIFKLVENAPTIEWDLTKPEDKVNVGDTITWDVNPSKKFTPIKDEDPIQIEWSIDQKTKYQKLKDRLSDFKSKIKTAKNWLQEQDPDIEIKYEHPIIDMVKEFLSKLKDKEKIKQYFLRLLDEIKSLPIGVKKNLLMKISFIFLSYVSIADITTPEIIEKEPVMAEVKLELQKEKIEKEKPLKQEVDFDNKELKGGSKFEVAQLGVHNAEGKYTDDRDDKGNWTGNEVGSGMLLGTKYGIAAPTLLNYYKKNNLGTPSQQDMMDLSYKTALNIYKKDYWDAQKLSNFKSQSLANVLYDGCVNQGPGATLGILTDALDEVDVDSTGINSWNEFHDELIDDVNELPTKKVRKLFHIIKDKRWEKYQLGRKKYHKGWKNRLDDITFNDDNIEKNQDIS
jgi:lysozyme family protein